jgi:hypothetical protein
MAGGDGDNCEKSERSEIVCKKQSLAAKHVFHATASDFADVTRQVATAIAVLQRPALHQILDLMSMSGK